MRKHILLLLSFFLLLLSACHRNNRFYNAEAEQLPLEIRMERFDCDFFALDSTELRARYGWFVDLYAYRVLNLRQLSELEEVKSDSMMQQLEREVNRVYPTMQATEQALTRAFRYYSYYFPQRPVPRVMTHLSAMNQNVVTADSLLSAGIDLYLGADFPLYKEVAYHYELPFMCPGHLPIDMMLSWLYSEFDPMEGDRMLESMLYQGRLLYLLQVCFPDTPEYELLSYTSVQYEWCTRYEPEVWAYLLEERALFSTDWKTQNHYMRPAPFTVGLSQDSPGRIGWYFGLRIVQAYMSRHPSMTLPELMQLSNAQEILQQSGYKP